MLSSVNRARTPAYVTAFIPRINPVSLSYQVDRCLRPTTFPRMCCENKAIGFVISTLVCDDTTGSRGSWSIAEHEKHLQRASWRTTEQSCTINTTGGSWTLRREILLTSKGRKAVVKDER